MNKFQPIAKLQEQVHNWHSKTHDDFSKTDQGMSWREGNQLAFRPEESLFSGVLDQLSLTDRAQHQLLQKLDAPRFNWIFDDKRCDPSLRADILNTLLGKRKPKKWLLRQRNLGADMVIRAILSDQYARYDHHQLVDAIALATETDGLKVQVARSHVDDYFRAYVIPTEIQSFGVPGEITTPTGDGEGSGGLFPAIYIRNDETGGGSLRITSGLFRSACTNGFIVGWRKDETFKLVHRSKSENLMQRMVHDAIASALKMSAEAAVRYLELQEVYLKPENLSDIVSSWSVKYGIGKKTAEKWDAQVELEQQQKGATSMASLINAATFQAQQIESIDVTEDFERMAGDMVMAQVPDHHIQIAGGRSW